MGAMLAMLKERDLLNRLQSVFFAITRQESVLFNPIRVDYRIVHSRLVVKRIKAHKATRFVCRLKRVL